LKRGFISAEEFDLVVDPKKMVDDPHRDLSVISLTRESRN
jgi:hypothetical protein